MSDWKSFVGNWHGFTETVFGFFDLSQTHHGDIMAKIDDLTAKVEKIAADLAAFVKVAGDEKAAIDAAVAAQKATDDAALEVLSAKLDAIEALIPVPAPPPAPAPVV